MFWFDWPASPHDKNLPCEQAFNWLHEGSVCREHQAFCGAAFMLFRREIHRKGWQRPFCKHPRVGLIIVLLTASESTTRGRTRKAVWR